MEETKVKCEETDVCSNVHEEEEATPHDTLDDVSLDNPELVVYKVTDATSPHLATLFGLQQLLMSLSSTISVPLITAGEICAGDLDLVKSEILSTFLFMCGVCTILQIVVGVRLPIIQGGCHKFIPAVVALMSLQQWKCPDMTRLDLASNVTVGLTDDEIRGVWTSRMLEIQGGIITSALVQMFIGCTGILGLLLHFVGPITILPTITLVGLSLIDVALRLCEKHLGIAALTVVLVLIFSLYLGEVRVPLPAYTKQKKCHMTKYPIFKMLPVILAVIISWTVCGILTTTNTLSNDPKSPEYSTRTDAQLGAISSASWFYFPYPCQWGMPTVSVSSFMAMLTATIASLVESVGDYYACARISGELPPPVHAVNRGVAIEGIGSILSGVVGSGGATTSYSQNVGAIGFTKVASRRAFIAAGIIFLVCGICGKFGALLTSIPDPVLGGILLVSFGMVTSVGLSNLQFVSLQSTRNLMIIGLTILVGLMIPRYLEKYPGCINTGNSELDNVLTVLLSTSMFVGGLIGFILDNTVPGTVKERGVIAWRQQVITGNAKGRGTTETIDIYDLPLITGWLKRQKWAAYIPFLPTFSPRIGRSGLCCKTKN